MKPRGNCFKTWSWRGNCDVWDSFKCGIKWSFEDGKLINFQIDDWLLFGGALKDKAIFNISKGLLQAKICFFVDDRGWKKDWLLNLLPPSVADQIAANDPIVRRNNPNGFFWNNTASGSFTAKEVYFFSLSISLY